MDDSKDISFSNLTDTISAQGYDYQTLDLSDITVSSPAYTMSPMTVSMPTITINSISGANVGYSNTMWTTGLSGTSAADLNQSGMLSLKGANADIDINGKSLMKTLEALEDRLNMLTPNPEMEAEWDQLRELGERYRELEQQCREKTQMWDKLKSMPKPNVKL
jgi:hypothetical protein